MEETTKYMAGGVVIGVVVGISALSLALYAKYQPIIDYVDSLKTVTV